MNLEATQHVLVRKSALFAFLVISIATLVRPLVAEQTIVFTLVGVANSVLMGTLYAFVSYVKPKPYHATLVVVCGFITLIPLMIISGGVNSQFSVVLPIIPVMVCLLSSARAAWYSTAVIFALVIAMRSLEAYLPNMTLEQVDMQKTNARAFWLCITTLLSATFAHEFYRLSRKLGNKLQHQASVDALTGLFNRGALLERLEAEIAQRQEKQQWLTVMMVDADKFKLINDSYGHLVGDECLRQIAAVLERSIRKHVDVVGRYGGEEFVLLLPDADQSAARRIAQLLLEGVRNIEMVVNEHALPLTVTIGYVSQPIHEHCTLEGLISAADQALYAGKQTGRDKAVGAEQQACTASTLGLPTSTIVTNPTKQPG